LPGSSPKKFDLEKLRPNEKEEGSPFTNRLAKGGVLKTIDFF
jgi:hypothetical protein